MITLDTVSKQTQHHLKGNASLLLNNPDQVWILQSGTIALFAVTLVQGKPEGSRRYLFSVKPGELLFTAPPTAANQVILAISTEASELLAIPTAAFIQRTDRTLLNTWIRNLCVVLAPETPRPIYHETIHPGVSAYLLDRGDFIQPASDTIAWIKVNGRAKWLDSPALTLHSGCGYLPISDRIWLEAEGSLELISAAVLDPLEFINGLTQLQIYCLRYIDWMEQRSLQEELQHFQAREQLNQQATADALGGLASVLNRRSRQFIDHSAPLLSAAGAVGRALGIEIRPPARSEDIARLKDPLDAIARASKIRIWRVLLTNQWWKQDCGPLLAYKLEDQQPVTLLPISANRYELFDPNRQVRIPVTGKVAGQLHQEAYTFYKSLPQTAMGAIALLKFGIYHRTADLITIILAGVGITLLGMLLPQGEDAMISIQGVLILSHGLRDYGPFQRVLKQLPEQLCQDL